MISNVINVYSIHSTRYVYIRIYLDDDDLQPPPNVSADVPAVRQYFQVAVFDRVRVVAFLTIYDLDFQPFEGNRYKPMTKKKSKTRKYIDIQY